MIVTPDVDPDNATSYCDVAYADAFFRMRVNDKSWSSLDGGKKEVALIQATRTIDTRFFSGEKLESEQALQFPRDGQEKVPEKVRYATCIMAVELIENDGSLFNDDHYDNQLYKSVQTGPIKVEYVNGEIKTPAQNEIDSLLSEFIHNNTFQVGLKRA